MEGYFNVIVFEIREFIFFLLLNSFVFINTDIRFGH